MTPTVSVIIPYYNRMHTIGRAINSVLQQTMQDFEVVVVDDASLDDLHAGVAPYAGDSRIRLLRQPVNQGPGAARNAGIAAARGRFVAFLDSDDTWLPAKLARQTETALAAPNPDLVFCATRTRVLLDGGREIIRPLRGPGPGRSFAEFLYLEGGFAQTSAFFLSRALAARVRFHEDMRQLEDHLFFIECGTAGAEYRLIDEVLTVWRNESAPDRASAADDLVKWTEIVRRFRVRAAPLVPERVLLAGEVRFLSGRLWEKAPARSVALMGRALLTGALPPRQIALLFGRNVLPSRLYDAARHLAAQRGAARSAQKAA